MARDVLTDGCTGVPFASPEVTQCCAVHDINGNDALFAKCLDAQLPEPLVNVGMFVMNVFRPAYVFMQEIGVAPRTPAFYLWREDMLYLFLAMGIAFAVGFVAGWVANALTSQNYIDNELAGVDDGDNR